MRKAKKLISLLLVCAMMIGFVPAALAEEFAARSGVTELDNTYIKIAVDNQTGRFSIRTADGQPARKNDQNANLLYGEETSFTTFKINGTNYIFGNAYEFELFQSEMSIPEIVKNEDGTSQINTVWSIEGVEITQIIKLYPTDDKVNGGNVAVRYEVNNKSNAKVELGTRILLDTQVGANDGPPMQMGAISDSPLSVERLLTHDPKNDQGIPDRDVNFYKIPAYWIMKDNLDPNNPLATNVFAYGFNNIAEAGVNILDKMIVGHWNRLANSKWIPLDAEGNESPAQEGLDFTTDTNDYGSADSAVALFWEPEAIAAGQTQTFETIYGLGEIIDPTTVFSIRFLDVPAMLETNEDKTAFLRNGVFKVRAEIENLAMYNMEHSEISATLTLDSGLAFAALDSSGNPIINPDGSVQTETGVGRTKTVTAKKALTPEEADAGVKATWKPGEIIPVEFTVVAKGNPWPSTKAYMLSASSPETEKQIGNITDAEVKALYNASRSSYIFLPPVGIATPTQVNEMSPEEVYWQDDKYITMNLTNIEAYNTGKLGDERDVANFDTYIVNTATNERWKVPVTESMVVSATGSGYSGDMRINYKMGQKVDAAGNVLEGSFYVGGEKVEYNKGPELPLGEYCVQIDFLGGPQTTPEDKQLLSVTSSQTFMVTTNKAAKIRNVGLLAVVKTNEDAGEWGGVLERALQAVTAPAQLVDSEFELPPYHTCDQNISGMDGNCSDATGTGGKHSLIPTYKLVPFESKEEFDKAFTDTNNDDNRWIGKNEKGEIIECMVTIEGIIRMVGDEGDIFVVDTTTEPAIINGAVAYKGTDLMFTKTSFLDYFSFFGMQDVVKGLLDGAKIPTTYLDALSIEGNGTLSIPSSGFTFHSGKWSIDFYNGFNKNAPEPEEEEEEDDEESQSPEDDSLNGSLSWATGGLGDRLNPLRQLAISDVYFNQHSLFSAPSFSVAGFGLKFNEFILKQNAITFGGSVDMSIVKAEIQGVGFDTEGFRFIESELSFELGEEMGLFSGGGGVGGSIILNHFRTPDLGKGYYGIKFNADMKNIAKVSVELAFARVPDGRILPDVIGFGAGFPEPGINISAGTFLKGVRGAIRELAETIAGGDGEVPLTIEAGVDIGFGVAPAVFNGSIDMTLKTSGIKLVGKMDFNEMPMLTYALIEARWFTPWFVKAEAEVDVMGWGIMIGNARLYLGQNLELNRIDFEGMISSAIIIPEIIPIVGGIELRKMTMGVNNDKIWGSIGILMIELGITYWWSGKLEFMTDGSDMPDAYAYLLMTDPDTGEQNLMLIGEGLQTLATSSVGQDMQNQTLEFHDVGDGMQMAEQSKAGIGGIAVSNMGKTHSIPMKAVKDLDTPSDALVEIEYFGSKIPTLTLKNGSKSYPINVMPAGTDMTKATDSAKYNSFVQEYTSNGVTQHKLYVTIPNKEIGDNNWTLTASETVETKLLSSPKAPGLKSVTLAKTDDLNYTANVTTDGALAGDTVSLYLTPVSPETRAVESENSEDYNEVPDPGTLIAKDLPLAEGKLTHAFDISNIVMKDAANKETSIDLRGLLAQGNYYLRAELKSASAFDTQTAPTPIKLVDPLAPNQVTDFQVTPAGNGYFNLSFAPGEVKTGAEVSGYAINFYQPKTHAKSRAVSMEDYPNYTGLTFTAEELAPYWNEATGRYENVRVGGQKTTDVLEKYTYMDEDPTKNETYQYYAMVDEFSNYVNAAGEVINATVDGQEVPLKSQRLLAQDVADCGIVLVKLVDGKYIRQDTKAEIAESQAIQLWVNSVETNDKGETVMQDGKPVVKTSFIGLQTGEAYYAGVSALHTEKRADSDLDHYSEEILTTSAVKLPVPKKPVLTLDIVRTRADELDAVVELYANMPEPTVSVVCDQPDVKVEIICGSDQFGTLDLVNGETGKTSAGQVKMNGFTTDGTYFIQLKATNTKTGDFSITGLYLTIDTLKPILFIDSPNPVTGTDELTDSGKVRVAGKTSPGDTLSINGVLYPNATGTNDPIEVVRKDGTFDFEIPMANEAIMKVEFTAVDKAGNSNAAAVYVANPNYKIPADITVQRATATRAADATINIGSTMPLTTNFVFKEKDETASTEGAPVYTKKTLTEAEMAIQDPNYKTKLSYEIYMGNSAELVKAADGTYSLKGLCEGGTVVKATYQIAEDVKLESYTSVDVTNITEGEADFNRMTLSTRPVGMVDRTRAIVENYVQDTVSELVYKTFPKGSAASIEPKAGDLLTAESGWKLLPTDEEGNHIITGVVAEQLLVVAKRVTTEGEKKDTCIGTSNRATILTKSGTSGNVYLEKAAAGDYEHTKLVIESGALKAGSEFVYKLDITTTPNVGDNLDEGWTVVPEGNLISARTGRNVAVAQRNITTKNCTESYKLMMAVADSFVNFAAEAESVSGNTTQTKVTVTGGRVLVTDESYVYLISESATKPVLYGTLSADWKPLPTDGLVTVADGSRILVAIKGTGGYAVGTANAITAEVSAGGGSGGGDDPGGSGGSGGSGGGSAGGTNTNSAAATAAGKLVAESLKDSGKVLGSTTALTNSDVVDVKLPSSVTADKITAVVFVTHDGDQTPIPFIRSAVKGVAYVTVKNMGVGSIVFVQMDATFTDVTADHWSAKDIKAAADKLFMSGVGADTFDRLSNASRSEFSTTVLRVMGAMSAKATATMSDVPATAWYYRGMAIAKQNGLLSGDDKGNMNPLENISRAEAMVIIGRALRIMKIENALSESEVTSVISKFSDGASVPAWARADAALCVKYGIINGANGALRPNDKLTREQTAAIANRLDTVLTSYLFVVSGQ